MNSVKRNEQDSRTIPVKEHIIILRITWWIEKLGYLLMFAVVLLALLGVFSNGVLSSKQETDEDHLLSINYERFARNGTQTEWIVRIKDNNDHPITLEVSDTIDKFYVIENIQPQSVQVSHQGERLFFIIPDNKEQQWHTFTFTLRPKEWGSFNANISIAGEKPITINQWIYP
ncbi:MULTISPECIES: hypothetical protein [unclassified Serratia (in: enterobacteria)]|uniref:hypothetical protein n=1 Tax=unclassified Serratia (in: enterobacteria) TaxID=2647522 RepID=UPI002ED54807|nr:hypothetical protein [Serratia sp. C2(2)]MEE4445770.1 hypothetical protein [Serratia sp. C2(1)]